jgi:hypothetical protein
MSGEEIVILFLSLFLGMGERGEEEERCGDTEGAEVMVHPKIPCRGRPAPTAASMN